MEVNANPQIISTNCKPFNRSRRLLKKRSFLIL